MKIDDLLQKKPKTIEKFLSSDYQISVSDNVADHVSAFSGSYYDNQKKGIFRLFQIFPLN